MELKKVYKIAIISPVPFYYHIPFYRTITESDSIDLNVIYCSEETLSGADVKKRYNTNDIVFYKEDLLKGYKYKFLKNYSPIPSFMNWPFGLMNFGVWKEVKRGNYDAVIFQSWTNLVWWVAFFACLRFNSPIFFMTDSNILSENCNPGWKKFLKSIILGKFLFKNSSGFFASGQANEMFYKNYGVADEKIARIPFSWGYEKLLKIAKHLQPNRDRIRESFGIKKEDFIILYVGRLSQEKMPLTILSAYKKVDRPDKRLFIVGDGPMKREFEEYIKTFNIQGVEVFGFQPHEKVSDFYIVADVLVLASMAETWGIVVTEAMCFSVPIITSDRVGVSMEFIKQGYNGFTFPVGDITKFSLAIEKVMDLPEAERKVFGQRSLEIVTEWVNSTYPVPKILHLLKKTKK